MECNRPTNTTWNIIYIFAILPLKDFLPWAFLEVVILGAYHTERASGVENGSQYTKLNFAVKAIVIQSRFRRTRFRTVVNNNRQNRRKAT